MIGWASVLALGILIYVWSDMARHPSTSDAYTYWNAWRDGHLYPRAWEPVSEYVYSPAFAQVLWPWMQLSFPVANAIWTALQMAALIWMLGPIGALAALIFPIPYFPGHGTAVFEAIDKGNPMVLTAAAITLGLTRWPGGFAFVLLTKLTAGIGIGWFLVRREGRRLGIAVGVTAAIVAVSAMFAPGLWIEWGRLLYGAVSTSGGAAERAKEELMPLPLVVRGPIGVGVVAIAGAAGWLWVVPIGCFLALPDIHLGGYAVLTAVPAVWLRRRSAAPSGK